jgi:hypothetical protein
MNIKNLKPGMWVYTKLGYGAVKRVGGTHPTSVRVAIFAPLPRGEVSMRPRDVERELHREELARLCQGPCDGPIIGAVTMYIGDEFPADRGERFRIVGVYRNALLPGVDIDAVGYRVSDNEQLVELGGVTKNDRVDAAYVHPDGRGSFVHTNPKAVDLALFAHLKDKP